jgi:hypothetical protein
MLISTSAVYEMPTRLSHLGRYFFSAFYHSVSLLLQDQIVDGKRL